MQVTAVVVAGGRGERFGGPKQFAMIDGRSVAAHSVANARSVAERVVLVVPADYTGGGEGADLVVIGGETRSDSVRAGLARVGDADIVVVHDAARPLATPALFHAVVDAVLAGATAAVPGLAVTDTVKRVRHDDGVTRIIGTVDRDEIVTVQTPQAFRRSDLEAAHQSGSITTDDATLLESVGALIVVVAGETTNIKVTEPADLERVALIRERVS